MAIKLERKQKLGKQSECVPSSTYSSVIPFAFRSYPPPPPPKKAEERNRGCPQEKNGREGNKILLSSSSSFRVFHFCWLTYPTGYMRGGGFSTGRFPFFIFGGGVLGGWSWRGGGDKSQFRANLIAAPSVPPSSPKKGPRKEENKPSHFGIGNQRYFCRKIATLKINSISFLSLFGLF